MTVNFCYFCGGPQPPSSSRRLIAATSTSAGVHTVRGFLQQCCSIEVDEYFLCKACFWKVKKGANACGTCPLCKQCGICVADFDLSYFCLYLLPAQLDQSGTSTKVKTRNPSITSCISVVISSLSNRVTATITKPPKKKNQNTVKQKSMEGHSG